MKKMALLFCMAALLFVSQSCVKEYTVSVYGVVTDFETKAPLEKAVVSVISGSGSIGSTGFMETKADGVYELTGITIYPKDENWLLINAIGPFGYYTGDLKVSDFSSDERREVNIELKKW